MTHKCPDCNNEFVQPFVCTTCGAQKLYDVTVTHLQEQNESLRSRLVEAEALIAKGLAVVHDFLPNIGRCVLQDYQRLIEFCSEAAARTAVSAVQPERCCVDYPRCDCNSPPEPDNAPTLQPCGHPWKAQHNFKCILCSSPGVTP